MDWKRIIIAVDDSETSVNAVNYVGSIIGKLSGTKLRLLHVYPAPPPGYYRKGNTIDDYQRKQEEKAAPFMNDAAERLKKAGVDGDAVSTSCIMADNGTISSTILELQQQGEYGTIVVGKRGISKSEEFLFGSISSALIHHGKDIAVWVVG